MAYRWKDKIEVDEAVVVVMNSLEKGPDLSPWLVRTITAAIDDSDPALGRYFFEEIQKHAPAAVGFFAREE
ncbi:MAG: Uncharacterized protein XE11_2108 [Methanomicrobiales archaeon 53_19]|jgi:hypothetical protein|uniref:hypothetical protein n=1 Tax=Methanocalculus sp. TaxID=2004547 RepID=UPI00074602FF|nr:hypothetical protein [Methanocalculus sp.]KUK70261.1 MAG: Uncharacterized protein XD88_0759 [Methanocalculus sp. 52_23]KUL01493.1 MAG: Uncharacterized protein XE11_2108 [Methanomicrobiales archaeon 53_19]HIJ07691.1 hypothetical protein [Methanocalculus sp.]